MRQILLAVVLLVLGCNSPVVPTEPVSVQLVASTTGSVLTGIKVGDQYTALSTTNDIDTLWVWGVRGDSVGVWMSGTGEKNLILRIDGREVAINETLGRLWYNGVIR